MKTILIMIMATVISVPAFGLTYDQNVTPDVIFGSGNINGSFTVDVQNGVELGLRGKLRFDPANQPQNIFNSNGDGTYSFLAGAAPGGFGWLPGSPTTPVWNFEWTVNVDATGGSKSVGTLDNYTFEIGLDDHPGSDETNFLVFDPITPTGSVPYWDHALGDNFGADVTAGDGPTYVNYLSIYNVAQNSWNYEFFNDAPWNTFDPALPGVYTIYLKAFQGGVEVAHTEIQILVGGAVGVEASSWGEVKSLFR